MHNVKYIRVIVGIRRYLEREEREESEREEEREAGGRERSEKRERETIPRHRDVHWHLRCPQNSCFSPKSSPQNES